MFPQKRQVNVAAASKRKFDLSHAHGTTTDFGRFKPIETRYMVPGDEFKYNIKSLTRVLNSMPSPTIGKIDVVFRGFFVPIHNIWSQFYDFIKNQPTFVNGVQVAVGGVPYVTPNDLYAFFTNTNYGLVDEVSQSEPLNPSDYDFYAITSTSPLTYKYWKFTRLGRLAYDFLTSLGLNFPLDRRDNSTHINMLPVIAFWKCYFDWIVPSRFIPNHEDNIERLIQKLNNKDDAQPYHISSAELNRYLVREPLSYYLDDVFTTGTLFPFQSENNLQDTYQIPNPADDNFDTYVERNPASYQNGAYAYGDVSGGDASAFNMYTLQTLGKLQDMLNRQLLAGSKVQDWLLEEFGMRPNNDALHLSTYLGSKRSSFAVADIMSTADTENAGGVALGSYAGFVKDRFDFDFAYKAQEHGYFFITYELVPRSSYFQGLVPEFNMTDRFDFFQPEFDNQQGEPVPFRSLYFDSKTPTGQSRPDDRFEFVSQYSLLKQATDVISGDFRNRFGLSLKSWFLVRDTGFLKNASLFLDGIDEEFCLVKAGYQDWHYIFADMTDMLDPFLTVFNIECTAMRPMKSIVEAFEPTYKNGNKDVSLDFSGSVK